MSPTRIFRQIQQWVSLLRKENQDPLAVLLHALEQHSLFTTALGQRKCALAIIDVPSGRYRYMTPLEPLLGYDTARFMAGGVNRALDLVHPADLQALRALNQEIEHQFQKCLATPDPFFYNSFDVRYRHADGSWRRLLQRNFVLEFDEQGGGLKTQLTLLYDISHLRKKDVASLCIISSALHEPCWLNFHMRGQQLQAAKALTSREEAILRLLAQGNSSNQIGQKLAITESTVNTHRRNMMRKTGSSSALELLGYSITAGIFDGYDAIEDLHRPMPRLQRSQVPGDQEHWLVNLLAGLCGTVVWLLNAQTYHIVYALGSNSVMHIESGDIVADPSGFFAKYLHPVYLAAAPAIFQDFDRFYRQYAAGQLKQLTCRYFIPMRVPLPEGIADRQFICRADPVASPDSSLSPQESNLIAVTLYHEHISMLEGRGLVFTFETENQKDIVLVETRQNSRGAYVVKSKDLMEPLTPREGLVMRYLMLGLETEEVARVTNLAPNTVNFYRNALLRKTGCHDIISLINMARLANLVPAAVLDDADLAKLMAPATTRPVQPKDGQVGSTLSALETLEDTPKD